MSKAGKSRPPTRFSRCSGKVKAVAAIYDVGTGKVHWLPSEKVDAILAKVESSNEE